MFFFFHEGVPLFQPKISLVKGNWHYFGGLWSSLSDRLLSRAQGPYCTRIWVYSGPGESNPKLTRWQPTKNATARVDTRMDVEITYCDAFQFSWICAFSPSIMLPIILVTLSAMRWNGRFTLKSWESVDRPTWIQPAQTTYAFASLKRNITFKIHFKRCAPCYWNYYMLKKKKKEEQYLPCNSCYLWYLPTSRHLKFI